MGRVGNVRESATTSRTWRKWAQNQAAQIDGQSHRAIGKSRETRAIAGCGFCANTRCRGAIIQGRVRKAGQSAKTRRTCAEYAENLATRIRCRPNRIVREFREMPAPAGFRFRAHTWRNGEIIHGRVANVRRSVKTSRTWGGAYVLRVRRPASMVYRARSSGYLEYSGRFPDSASGHIRGLGARLCRGSSESRRRRGAIGANGPRILRLGPDVDLV